MKKQTELGRLSEMEMEVLREVWGMAAPATVSRVLAIFAERYGWKSSTLSTIMDRLIEKGYLTKTMHGKANVYTPALSEAAYKEHETRAFMAAVHNGSVKSFVAALTDGSGMNADEIAEIRSWFHEKAGEEL